MLLAILGIIIWFLFGFVGYTIMHCCDTATGQMFCRGRYYVIDMPVKSFILCLILGLISLLAGIAALEEWKEYTLKLKKDKELTEQEVKVLAERLRNIALDNQLCVENDDFAFNSYSSQLVP